MLSKIVLALAVVSAIGVAVAASAILLQGGSSPGEEARKVDLTGAHLVCASGPGATAIFQAEGDDFRVVGRLLQFDANQFTIAGPKGPIVLALQPSAHVSGEYLAGDPMQATGTVGPDGRYLASDVSPVCEEKAYVAVESTSAPVPSPQAPPAPAPTLAPKRSPIIVEQPPAQVKPVKSDKKHQRH